MRQEELIKGEVLIFDKMNEFKLYEALFLASESGIFKKHEERFNKTNKFSTRPLFLLSEGGTYKKGGGKGS